MSLTLVALGLQTALAAPATCPDCNVLWIVMDATRNDYVGPAADGWSNTPNLDRLARRGLAFDHAYAQGPDTMVSVSSYMTGRYRINTGMDFTTFNREQAFHPLADEVTSIAEVLKTRDYSTVGLTANAVIAAHEWDLGLHQGFDRWDRTDDLEIAAKGIAALDQLRGGPFLLYVHLMGPHFPNERAPDFEARRGKAFPADLPQAVGSIYSDIRKGKKVLSQREGDYLRALYADDVWAADREIGKILDHLEKLGLHEKTVVVFTSDHGESLGEVVGTTPWWGHGGALRDTVLHVPLYIAGPGIPHKKVGAEQIVELVDLAPSLAAYLGIPVAAEWLWEGDPVLGDAPVVGTWSISDRGIPPSYALNIRDAEHSVHYWPEKGKYFYANLATDPTEQSFGTPPPAQEALMEHVTRYWDQQHPPGAAAQMDAPDGELLEQLQTLGYMED